MFRLLLLIPTLFFLTRSYPTANITCAVADGCNFNTFYCSNCTISCIAWRTCFAATIYCDNCNIICTAEVSCFGVKIYSSTSIKNIRCHYNSCGGTAIQLTNGATLNNLICATTFACSNVRLVIGDNIHGSVGSWGCYTADACPSLKVYCKTGSICYPTHSTLGSLQHSAVVLCESDALNCTCDSNYYICLEAPNVFGSINLTNYEIIEPTQYQSSFSCSDASDGCYIDCTTSDYCSNTAFYCADNIPCIINCNNMVLSKCDWVSIFGNNASILEIDCKEYSNYLCLDYSTIHLSNNVNNIYLHGNNEFPSIVSSENSILNLFYYRVLDILYFNGGNRQWTLTDVKEVNLQFYGNYQIDQNTIYGLTIVLPNENNDVNLLCSENADCSKLILSTTHGVPESVSINCTDNSVCTGMTVNCNNGSCVYNTNNTCYGICGVTNNPSMSPTINPTFQPSNPPTVITNNPSFYPTVTILQNYPTNPTKITPTISPTIVSNKPKKRKNSFLSKSSLLLTLIFPIGTFLLVCIIVTIVFTIRYKKRRKYLKNVNSKFEKDFELQKVEMPSQSSIFGNSKISLHYNKSTKNETNNDYVTNDITPENVKLQNKFSANSVVESDMEIESMFNGSNHNRNNNQQTIQNGNNTTKSEDITKSHENMSIVQNNDENLDNIVEVEEDSSGGSNNLISTNKATKVSENE